MEQCDDSGNRKLELFEFCQFCDQQFYHDRVCKQKSVYIDYIQSCIHEDSVCNHDKHGFHLHATEED